MEDDLNLQRTEDNLNILANGNYPIFFKMEDDLKTTLLKTFFVWIPNLFAFGSKILALVIVYFHHIGHSFYDKVKT